MNKKWIIAAMVASAPLLAQADNVEIYGLMDTSLNYGKIQGGTSQNYVGTDNSAFGLRGSEKINNQLKAEFQIENAIDTTGGVTGGLNRKDTFVGLNDETLGIFRAGFLQTPAYQLFSKVISVFGEGGMTGYVNSTGTGNATTHRLSSLADLGKRMSDAVYYRTPNFGDIAFADIQVAKGNIPSSTGTINSSFTRVIDARIQYGLGNTPLTAGVAIRNQKTLTDQDNNIYLVAISYKQAPFSINAGYEGDDYKATSVKDNKFYLSGTYAINQQLSLLASSGIARNIEVNGTTSPDTGAKQFSFGAQYAFSKRTQVYGYYTKLNNGSNAVYTILSGSPTGADNEGIGIGIRHSF